MVNVDKLCSVILNSIVYSLMKTGFDEYVLKIIMNKWINELEELWLISIEFWMMQMNKSEFRRRPSSIGSTRTSRR